MATRIAFSDSQCGFTDVHCGDIEVGACMSERNWNSAGPCAEIKNVVAGLKAFQRQLDQQFSFRAGNQDIGSDGKCQSIELAFAGDVGNRFTVYSAVKHCTQGFCFVRRQGVLGPGNQVDS